MLQTHTLQSKFNARRAHLQNPLASATCTKTESSLRGSRSHTLLMDISSLLSPCVEAEPSQAPASSSLGCSDMSSAQTAASGNNHHLEPVSQQTVTLAQAASRASPFGRRVQTTGTALAALLKTTGAKKSLQQQPVKRKRKRRLTVKQLQVKSENQRDESQLYNLTLDINDLKQQVRDYMVRKSIHETRTFVARQRYDAGVMRTTRHFFEVFRVGHREWEPQEAAFLAATIDQNVVISSDVRGADTFFEQWKRYKKMLQPRYVMITSAHILASDSDSCVVECRGEFEGKLTLAAIETLFPHILGDTVLLSKVVNCRLVCPTHTLIYFDASGRIVQYDAHADMFEGLNRILAANPLDVITLMSNARISAEGSMIPDQDDINNEEVRFMTEDDKDPELRGDIESAPVPGSPVDSMASNQASGSPSSRSSCSSRSSVEYILS